MLTPRENLLRAYHHEMPEWIPVVGHVDPYNQPHKRGMDPVLLEQLAQVQWHDESTINFSRYLGLDISDFYYAPIITRQRRVTVESEMCDNTRTTRWITLRGVLQEVTHFSPDTGMWYTAEHAVKEVADLPLLASVFEDMEFELDPQGVAALKQRRELVGDDGIVTFAMTGTPLGQMVRVHAGVETTGYLWADGPREMHDLFAVMADNHLRQFRLAASLDGVDAVLGMDDTSTTTISPAMFEEFCLGYTDEVADTLHAGGKMYFHHSCGLIHDLLDLYRQTKMDAVHGFTVPSIGNVSIAQGKEKLGSKITIIVGLPQLCGNMDDREAVRQDIAKMFEEAKPGDNIVFGLAPDPGKDMEETAFVANVCKEYQRMVGG
ncbi:MAG: uroporphyrinogen decarboxylase family protein [Armatimonadota bacterium]